MKKMLKISIVILLISLFSSLSGCLTSLHMLVYPPKDVVTGTVFLDYDAVYTYSEWFSPPEPYITVTCSIIQKDGQPYVKELGSYTGKVIPFEWNTNDEETGLYEIMMRVTYLRPDWPEQSDYDTFKVLVVHCKECQPSGNESSSGEEGKGAITKCPNCAQGSPIIALTGEFTNSNKDLSLHKNTSINRTYLSKGFYSGPFGPKWYTNLTLQVIEVLRGSQEIALVRMSGGTKLRFVKQPDGSYESPARNKHLKMVKLPSGLMQLTDNGGNIYNFNAQGYTDTVVDANNNSVQYRYEGGTGRILSIVSSTGQQFNFQYGANLLVSKITDNSGREVSYQYDDDRQLVVFTDPEEFTIGYEHDESGKIVRIRDHLNRTLNSVAYDTPTSRVSDCYYDGQNWSYVHDKFNRRLFATDSREKTKIMTYTMAGKSSIKTDRMGNKIITHQCSTCSGPKYFVDELGNRTDYEYDDRGNLLSVTASDGTTTSKTYTTVNGKDVPWIVTDELGNKTTYGYDSLGNMNYLKDALGNEQHWTYTQEGWLSTYTDANDHTTIYTYFPDGSLASVTNALGHSRSYTYDSRGNKLSETDELGNTTTYEYDKKDNLIATTLPPNAQGERATTRYEHDQFGNVVKTIDPLGNETKQEYDQFSRLHKTIDALNNETVNTFDDLGRLIARTDALGHVTSSEYDANGRLVKTIDALENETEYVYDAAGRRIAKIDAQDNQTDFEYDSRGRLVKTIAPPDAQNQRPTVLFAYDSAGRLYQKTDAKGVVTRYEYDSQGRQIATVEAVGTSIERRKEQTYDEAGQLNTVKDPRGNVTTMHYDELGRAVSTEDALGNSDLITYDEAGRRESVRDKDGNTTHFVYDDRGMLVEVLHPDGASEQFEYDLAGRRVAVVDGMGRRTEMEYSARGELLKRRRYLDGQPIEATFEYDELSNRVRAVDEGGRETDYHFDELNRLVETVKASPDGVAGRPVEKKGYDSLGRLVSYENENGSVWRFGFDGLGRLVSEEDPLGQGKSYVHDLSGNVVGKTDAKGQVTSFGYDELNRLVRVDFADGKWAALSYDSADNRVGLTGSSGSETMSVSQAFDELNRLQSVTNGNLGRELRYGYTAAGRRSSMSLVNLADSSSKTSSYSWDSRGRVASIVPWAGSAVSYGYNPDGTRATVALPNGLSLSHSYDSLGRLAEMRYENGAGESVGFFRYTLDVMGNRVQVEDAEGVSSYSYDSLDRLVEAQYPDGSWERFGMDLAGNRVRHEDGDGVTSYLLDAGDRLLATSGAKAAVYTWDANGNMLTKTDSAGTSSYTWDGRDKLVSVSLPGGAGSVSYGYYPLSDLRSYVQGADGVEKRFLYDGSNVVEEIAGGSLATLAGYIDGDGVDQHLARVVGGDVYAYVGDALGTVRGVFDASGQAVNSYAYKAYGEVRSAGGSDVAQNPYRFTGRRWDGDVGEYYYRARYYQPGLGRFSAVDPLVPAQRAYGYVDANPIMKTDPAGQYPLDKVLQSVAVKIQIKVLIGGAIVAAMVSAGMFALSAYYEYGPNGPASMCDPKNFKRMCEDGISLKWCNKISYSALQRQLDTAAENLVEAKELEKNPNDRTAADNLSGQGKKALMGGFRPNPRGFGPVRFNLPSLSVYTGERGSALYCSILAHECIHYYQYKIYGGATRFIVKAKNANWMTVPKTRAIFEKQAYTFQQQWINGTIKCLDKKCCDTNWRNKE